MAAMMVSARTIPTNAYQLIGRVIAGICKKRLNSAKDLIHGRLLSASVSVALGCPA
jgi:hypothetical protein